jgi:hypothetical protein
MECLLHADTEMKNTCSGLSNVSSRETNNKPSRLREETKSASNAIDLHSVISSQRWSQDFGPDRPTLRVYA